MQGNRACDAEFRMLRRYDLTVAHTGSGLGTVTATRGAGDSTQAEVDFGGDTGVKRFLLRFA